MLITVGEVLNVTGGELLQGDPGGCFCGFIIDSRQAKGEELFFPLQGEKENGHRYIIHALKNGASGSLLEERFISDFRSVGFPEGKTVIVVDESLRCLQEIARYHRKKFSLPVIAVTGSNGKTTTKDLISSVLSIRYNVFKTEGNLNNHIGLPLMLLNLKKEHRAAVVEMGMSAPGEISLLASLAKPALGVITNIGEAHLGLLGSKENIARAKGELLDAMGAEGKAFLNGDDLFLRRMGKKYKGESFFYGFQEGVNLRALNSVSGDFGSRFEVTFSDNGVETFRIPLMGRHNVYNALAAIALGLEFSLGIDEIKEGLSKSVVTGMRMEKSLSRSGFWVINDSYNANPTSMKAALQSLKETAGKARSIAVLGDMLELGAAAEEEHLKVGKYSAELDIDYLITVGSLGAIIARGARSAGLPTSRVITAGNHREALDYLDSLHLTGSFILVKGSRGMRMETIANELLS